MFVGTDIASSTSTASGSIPIGDTVTPATRAAIRKITVCPAVTTHDARSTPGQADLASSP
jgi:hypothetical protein